MPRRTTHNRWRIVLGVLAATLLAACGTRASDDEFAGDDAESELDATTATGGATGEPGAGVETGANPASDVGITERTIRLGTIVAENGVLGDAFAPAVWGLRAWTEWINSQGGINGRLVELFTCDDREDRARSLECARQLVEEDEVFALVATNSRALGGAAPYLNEQNIPVLGIPITNSFYRYPHFYSVYGSGYPNDGTTVGNDGLLMQVTSTYRWFRENVGATNAAVFSYDISESIQAADFIEQGLRLEGYTDIARYTVSFAAPSFDQPVADMQRRGTQIIFDAMDDGANRRLCDAMARRQFTVAAKVTTIVGYGDEVGTTINDACRNSTYIPGDSIPYSTTSVPIIAAFNEAMAQYQPDKPLHQWELEAWALATMVRDGVGSMGPAPTRAGFEEWIRAQDNFTADGIMNGISYLPDDFSQPRARDCFAIARWQDSTGGFSLVNPPFPQCYEDSQRYGTPARENGD
jgi:branched-chain amino acid transport system substrate-binding protein